MVAISFLQLVSNATMTDKKADSGKRGANAAQLADRLLKRPRAEQLLEAGGDGGAAGVEVVLDRDRLRARVDGPLPSVAVGGAPFDQPLCRQAMQGARRGRPRDRE